MAQDERGDVADRPLGGLLLGERNPAEHERTERVRGVERAVAATTHVRLAAPVDELVAGRRGQQNLSGGRARERRPDAGEDVRVGGGVQAAVLNGRVDHRERPFDAPADAARILHEAARAEAQLAVDGA